MPQQTVPSAINNFSKGLKTEFTGLNFPEDAVTDCDNCVFNRIGNVTRRPGIDYETNYSQQTVNRTSSAISSYKWNNVGGDGLTQILVKQIGATLYFFRSSTATAASPLSTTQLGSTVDVSSFVASGGTYNAALECQYSDGNGYLFVTHPSCDPFYCTYTVGTITSTRITVKIRDFAGISELGVDDTFRPSSLTTSHQYNLQNQGWSNTPSWTANSSTSNLTNTGSMTWTVQTGLTITATQAVTLRGSSIVTFSDEVGVVTSYNSGTGQLVINVTSSSQPGFTATSWTFALSTSATNIATWHSAVGNYPANSDVWWLFKNASNIFDPATTINNVTLNSGPAPKGFYILDAFNQLRATISGIAGLSAVTATVRPKANCWFQGRVWYTSVDASPFSEQLYFSQIIEREDQFGKCYQTNDPTSEDRFDLLPTDGGVVKIQGCGAIYKLFPLQNGLLVFAANGIWFITGSQGIGFAANDYTINKISAIQSISATSFINVQGLPMWCNAEGVYTITLGQNDQQYGASRAYGGGGLQVKPLTFTTIQSFYDNIPLSSKKYIRGDYDPLDWIVRWCFKSTEETNVTDRYEFDRVLIYNVATEAFYPYQVSGNVKIHGLNYIQSPGGSTAPDPSIKYIVSISNAASYDFTFAEENDTTHWVDWFTTSQDFAFSYTSYFISAYRLKGQAQHKFQSNYLYLYTNNTDRSSYKLQGIWDFAISGDSGKFTNLQQTTIDTDTDDFSVAVRRHRIRGRGLALQYKITSVQEQPFDIIGWSVEEKVNTGV